MKSGRPTWTTKCPAETLRQVMEAVDARDASTREIFDRLNLARYVRLSTFKHWVTTRRKERADRLETGPTRFGFNQTGHSAQPSAVSDQPEEAGGLATLMPGGPVPATVVDLVIAQCVEAISEAMAAGRVGKLDVGKALRSLAALKELSIAESAEQRAREIHEVKLAELRRKQAAALEEVSQATGLTDEQLGQIKARVLGI